MIDASRALKIAVDTGTVWFGTRRTRKAVRQGTARLVVVAANCPDTSLRTQTKVRVHTFPGSSLELGSACGKPFAVSAVAVVNPGESNILSV